jgi:hypothetical protein
MATFSNIVMVASSQNPQSSVVSLSSPNNSVVQITTNVVSFSGKIVTGILFNEIAGASTASITLTAMSGLRFKVAPEYNGATFALYTTDRRTTTFTVNTSLSAAVQITSATWTTDNRGPVERRLHLLGYI